MERKKKPPLFGSREWWSNEKNHTGKNKAVTVRRKKSKWSVRVVRSGNKPIVATQRKQEAIMEAKRFLSRWRGGVVYVWSGRRVTAVICVAKDS